MYLLRPREECVLIVGGRGVAVSCVQAQKHEDTVALSLQFMNKVKGRVADVC